MMLFSMGSLGQRSIGIVNTPRLEHLGKDVNAPTYLDIILMFLSLFAESIGSVIRQNKKFNIFNSFVKFKIMYPTLHSRKDGISCER